MKRNQEKGKTGFLYRRKYTFSIIIILFIGYLLLPSPTFDEPTSTVLYSADNSLLGARIAKDEQWRFPLIDTVPIKFKASIINFEDKYFNYHPGFNPVSLLRALIQNIKASEVKSGGSTLTMQVVRLSRKGQSRTIKEKLIELVLATKLELKYSKREILGIYTSYAPFGGNVVGLEAASWRYFGRPPKNLTWAESAMLAVLPNAPSLIYPGKNQLALKNKRDRLLLKLLNENIIDSLTYTLSLKERIPLKPKRLPNKAPHLLAYVMKKQPGQKVKTSINSKYQASAYQALNNHVKHLQANEIYNGAVIVIDNKTSEIIAYIGNSDVNTDHGNYVDIIRSARSTGSILKPLLYAALINEGEMLPRSLIPDIPMFMEGFSPKNYSLQFDGAVPASKALSRSLNVPAVHMLADYGVARFHNLLKKLQFSTLTHASDYYGLSLILGGAEATLYDLASVYSGMSKTLTNVVERDYAYSDTDFNKASFKSIKPSKSNLSEYPPIYSAASIWVTFEALMEVNRPDNESGWKSFASANKIAWKTGTSFGFRDAWAIGVCPEYTVAVWAGNADGEGRPGLTGVTAAAPLMFDVFNFLNPTGWFQEPFDEFKVANICAESGFLAGVNCTNIDTTYIPAKGLRSKPCPYHKLIHLDKSETYRVNSSCVNPEDIVQKSWFVLPPAMESYFKQRNPFYISLPPYMAGCNADGSHAAMEFIYPKESTKLYIPIKMSGEKGKVVFEVAHRNSSVTLFWHLDNEFLGTTMEYHEFGLQPAIGSHVITVVDGLGNTISKSFEVVSK